MDPSLDRQESEKNYENYTDPEQQNDINFQQNIAIDNNNYQEEDKVQIDENSQNIQYQAKPQQQLTGDIIKIGQTQLVIKKRTSQIDLKLFVGQLPKQWQEQDVTNYFAQFGEILESQIIRDTRTGAHRGCAFVKFASMTQAEKAIDQLQNKVNNPVQIKWADGEAERLGVKPGQPAKLFIGSLTKECTEQNLRDIFEPFGEIEELHLMKDQEGRSKGCAFIRYKRNESALIAIKNLNAQAFLENSDRPIEVRFAEIKSQIPPIQPKPTPNPQPMPTQVFTQYFTSDNIPYYYNWMTGMTQYELPPTGALVYRADGSYFVIEEQQQQQSFGGRDSNKPGYVINDIPNADIKGTKPGPQGANLFIFHLPNDFKDSDLFKLFSQFGEVISARVMTKPDGRSRGYGFVSYENQSSAQKAITKLNGYSINGKRLKVEVKKGDGSSDSSAQYTSLQQSNFNPFF